MSKIQNALQASGSDCPLGLVDQDHLGFSARSDGIMLITFVLCK